jgi:hypothetical protein
MIGADGHAIEGGRFATALFMRPQHNLTLGRRETKGNQ